MIKQVSLRRCSRVSGQRSASLYYKPKQNAAQRQNEDAEIAKMLHSKASEKPN
jgi:hypothetical protein